MSDWQNPFGRPPRGRPGPPESLRWCRFPRFSSVLGLLCLLSLIASASPAEAQAPSVDTGRCAQGADALARVMCRGTLRVGLRSGYEPFANWKNGVPQGFEPELAQALAGRLGVRLEAVQVTPANRLALIGEGKVDLVLATMGHTLQRDTQALFVRPHYFQSKTVVVGERGEPLAGLDEIGSRPVCVTVGNLTNAELASRGARLMLYDSAPAMLEQMRLGGCRLAAQDDTFFADALREPSLAARRETKFGFAPTPWGMAVSREDGQSLAQRLSLELQVLHAGGELLSIAGLHGVATDFLLTEQRRWNEPPCALASRSAGQTPPEACLLPPRDAALKATPMAEAVGGFERAVLERLGIRISLPMLKTHVALELFLTGIGFSLALVFGAVASTVGLSTAFAAGLCSRHAPLRWAARVVQAAMQSTPLVLLMLVCDVIITSLQWQSPLVSLAAAVLVLGLFNGSNAGQAVAEAWHEENREHGTAVGLAQALQRARAQLMSFAVNATRGSPAASVMGVPELLSAQMDISSFVNERTTTYALLLVFYVAVVLVVIALGNRLQARWDATHEATPTDDISGAGVRR